MAGIVGCEDCHPYDPGSPWNIEPGNRSCLRCHSDDYMKVFDDLRNTLIKETLALPSGRINQDITRSIRKKIHNIHLALEETRRTAVR